MGLLGLHLLLLLLGLHLLLLWELGVRQGLRELLLAGRGDGRSDAAARGPTALHHDRIVA